MARVIYPTRPRRKPPTKNEQFVSQSIVVQQRELVSEQQASPQGNVFEQFHKLQIDEESLENKDRKQCEQSSVKLKPKNSATLRHRKPIPLGAGTSPNGLQVDEIAGDAESIY